MVQSIVNNVSGLIGNTFTQALGNPIYLGLLILLLFVLVVVILRFTLAMSLIILIPVFLLVIPSVPVMKIIMIIIIGGIVTRGFIHSFRGGG